MEGTEKGGGLYNKSEEGGGGGGGGGNVSLFQVIAQKRFVLKMECRSKNLNHHDLRSCNNMKYHH
jgi:hypothetical protein